MTLLPLSQSSPGEVGQDCVTHNKYPYDAKLPDRVAELLKSNASAGTILFEILYSFLVWERSWMREEWSPMVEWCQLNQLGVAKWSPKPGKVEPSWFAGGKVLYYAEWISCRPFAQPHFGCSQL